MNASAPALDLLLPGDPSTLTGGYLYDRRILQGLARLGWKTATHRLDESFPTPSPAGLAHAREVMETIPAGRIVVIDGLALAGLLPVLEEQAGRLSVVALIHHPLALETGLEPALAAALDEAERSALARVQRVIVTSRWTAAALDAYGVSHERIRVVEPGIDRLPPARGSRSDVVQLLCVATLTPRKGHATLFDALALVADRRWALRCVGSLTRAPRTVAALRQQLADLQLSDRVELVGDVLPEHLSTYYDEADLFVLASHMEGYGMALAEAVARGLPIVSTTAGAIPETVPKGAGRLVPPGDSRALADALAELLDQPTQRTALARGALAARATLSTWSAAAAGFAGALEGL